MRFYSYGICKNISIAQPSKPYRTVLSPPPQSTGPLCSVYVMISIFRRSLTHVLDSNRYHSYEKTTSLKSPVPCNMTVYKGWKNVIMSRNFSNFTLHHPVAKIFRDWTKDMEIPDEEFFPTLARITKIQKTHGNYTVTQNHVDRLPMKKGRVAISQ